MTLAELRDIFASHPQMKAIVQSLLQGRDRNLRIGGLRASARALCCSTIASRVGGVVLIVLSDMEEAGYFYNDLSLIDGEEAVLFFPAPYRQAKRKDIVDPANLILRNEVLSRLTADAGRLCIVSYPDAIVEPVVGKDELRRNTLLIHQGEHLDMDFVIEVLSSHGFERVDYVYLPGQYAVRGSLIDVFSYSCEYPYRIDFFGDEVDSLRTFEVDTQLSLEKREVIAINNEQPTAEGGSSVSLLDYLTDRAIVVHNADWVAEREKLRPCRHILLSDHPASPDETCYSFSIETQPLFHKNFDLVSASLSRYLADGYTLYICSDSPKQIDRLSTIFSERGENISFTAVERTLHEGFAEPALRLCVYTDHQIFDRFHRYNLRSDRARAGKVALSLRDLNTFHPGDYVVHVDHGIGRFAGLIRIPTPGGGTQEVMKIVYRDDDTVFVSIHSLHKVSRYKGREGEVPRLNKIGTGAWEKLKERTKSKIKDIARDLIMLYARRREEQGFAFSPDSFLQHELEASFAYEDTPDQSRATLDVKTDMESQRPMDRLVCGDVGFGKTEVAIRAAFKAVADNKQVAVLVPTTVLAYQHFHTFSRRLKDMPCRIDYLSRARTPADTRQLLRDLQDGRINIIIGTHKLLGREVKFHDLGLLIIDEEQKFGVSVKEKLRQLRVNVDTLTLTATPIPRTLQFSLMGARDLSVIQTPPPNRYPIQTEICTFDEELIADAIRFEMGRGGQVFFVNNRVSNLGELRNTLLRHIPECRVAIGHGQMPPTELEQVVFDFINYDYDVLLATTIVENGVDIPNANTIIINQAHCFGLSDLHQMRGRVGRGNRRAYCYLIAPPLRELPDDARRRLQAIENFSGLGSGLQIAMQDLDIRGAGNLLGAEQSGFIADVGYDTYQRILTEAVRELKTTEFASIYAEREQTEGRWVDECTVESDIEMMLPDRYVTGSAERMLLYRELDSLTADEQVDAFRRRLEDRFGPLPREAVDLLRVPALRREGAKAGVEKVILKGGRMTLMLVADDQSAYYQSAAFDRLIAYAVAHPARCEMREGGQGRRTMLVRDVESVEEAVSIVGEMANEGKKNGA